MIKLNIIQIIIKEYYNISTPSKCIDYLSYEMKNEITDVKEVNSPKIVTDKLM